MRKKQVLVLTDQLEWAQFASENFRRIAGDLADFEIVCGGFNYDFNSNDWVDQYVHSADIIWAAHPYTIFPPWLVNSKTCVNSHPGYNPYNRGWYPYVFSIVNGLPAGATLHLMDEKIDHGPIIAQKQVTVEPYDTAYTLWKRCRAVEHELILKYLRRVIEGNYAARRMTHSGNYNCRADYEALQRPFANDEMTAEQWVRRLRALSWVNKSNLILDEKYGWDQPDYEILLRNLHE